MSRLRTTNMDESDVLNRVYESALEGNGDQNVAGLGHPVLGELREIVDRTDKQKSVLAVTTTLLLKKIMDPAQDIRQHQASMPGGFSGRTLDTRVVTPFLRSNGFPYMGSGSGWLTRSLEQATPYTLDYPGGVKPKELKKAFLNVVDAIQRDGSIAEPALRHLFRLLIDRRDQDRSLKLARPINLSDLEIVQSLARHFNSGVQGSSRLPVLAIHAIMSVLVGERGKYDGCSIANLESHTSADAKSGLIGDIHILDRDGNFVEAFEIKHDVRITEALIQDCFVKYRNTSVRRFYILTTHESGGSGSGFEDMVARLTTLHGCQLIVNGVEQTVKYFLRIIADTQRFIDAYVSHLESDRSVSYELKMKWNAAVGMGESP